MWKLGKFVVMTRGELWKMNKDADARGYKAGLRSKWRAKKKEGGLEPPPGESFVDDVLAANRGDTTTEVGKILNGVVDDTEALLSAVDDNVIIPQRAA